MRLALIHDHLNQEGGAEKVLHVLHTMWPEAPIFTLIHDTAHIGLFKNADVRPSFIQKIPLAKKMFRLCLPLMPTATESYDLSDFDVVISSSSAFAKGAITKPNTLHICYCHTPTRYLWSDTKEYVSELNVPAVVKLCLPPLLTWLRIWDKAAADGVDLFVANSHTVAHRIKKYYGRDAVVINPPVETDSFSISREPKKYFLSGGRLVAYKRFDLVVNALTKLGLPLKIFGTGPIQSDLKKIAGKNVEFLGRVSNEEKAKLYQGAIAFIHPQEEDFGITPIESMASGRPVIAYRRGGVLESIVEDKTGVFFDDQSWERLATTVRDFDETKFNPETIRAHAIKYSTERFKEKFSKFVHDKHVEFKKSQTHPCE